MRSQIMNSYLPIALTVVVVTLLLILRYLPFSWARKIGLDNAGTGEAQLLAPEVGEHAVPEEVRPEIVPDALVVKHLKEGMATLLLRERSHLGKCTAHLIVWAGKKRRKTKSRPGGMVLVQDSYYDLGCTDGCELTEQVVEAFVRAAEVKLKDLVVAGMMKLQAKKDAAVESPAEEVLVAQSDAAVTETAPVEATVTIEENKKPDPAIKLRRFPSVFRGKVLEMGMMPKPCTEGDVPCYGVRYRTPEGVEDVLWGVNLRTAFHEARAGVGDDVEILKIGRKTVEEGKAPMNLYTVTKLSPEQVQAH